MITGADNKFYRQEVSYESRILNGEPITEEEITKPLAFLFNNIANSITDSKTAGNVMKFIFTLKRDEDVLNCLSHVYNDNTKQHLVHLDNYDTAWLPCALRCCDYLDYHKASMSDKTCRL